MTMELFAYPYMESFFGENADSYWTIPTLELPQEKFDRKIKFKTDNPVIAELSRRLILASKYVGKTPSGLPKISIKSSFKDAAHAVDVQNLPTPNEFKVFYSENRKVFPKFLTFFAFMQIIINEVPMSPKLRSYYRRSIMGDDLQSFSVSSQPFNPSAEKEKPGKDSITKENDQAKKRLLEALAEQLGNGDVDNLRDLVDRLLKDSE